MPAASSPPATRATCPPSARRCCANSSSAGPSARSYLRLGAGELAELQPMAQLYEALVMQAMRSLVPAAPIRLHEQDRHDWAFSPTSCNSRAVGSALSTSGDVPDRQPHGGRPSRPRIPSTSGSGALGGAAWRRAAAAASAHDDPRLGDGPPRRPTGAGPGPPAGGCSPRRVGFLTAVFGRCPAARSCPDGPLELELARCHGLGRFERQAAVEEITAHLLFSTVQRGLARSGWVAFLLSPVWCGSVVACGMTVRMTSNAS